MDAAQAIDPVATAERAAALFQRNALAAVAGFLVVAVVVVFWRLQAAHDAAKEAAEAHKRELVDLVKTSTAVMVRLEHVQRGLVALLGGGRPRRRHSPAKGTPAVEPPTKVEPLP
jgi:hypothetical protein